MPGATLPATGTADWQDVTHNWREADAEWIQARTVTRHTNNSGFLADSGLSSGSVGFSTTAQKLYVNSSSATSAAGDEISSSTLFRMRDDGGNSRVNFNYDTNTALRLYSDQTVFADTVISVAGSKATPRVKMDTNGVEVNTTGSNPVTMSSTANGMAFTSAGIFPGLDITGNVLINNSNLHVSGAGAQVTFDSPLLMNGAALTITGATLTSSTSSLGIASAQKFTAGNYTMDTSGVTHSSEAATISYTNDTVDISAANGADLQAPAGAAPTITIDGDSAPIAGWLQGSANPSVDAPDGTIYFQY